MALRFSAKLARWPMDGLDGVRERAAASLVEGVRVMFELDCERDGGLLLPLAGD